MREIFASARAERTTLSFEAARARAAEAKQTTMEKIIVAIQTSIHSRPVLWIAGVLGTLALFFIALVPFSYTQTVGYSVSVAGLGEHLRTPPELLSAAMTASGLTDIKVSSTVNNGVESYVFAPLGSETEAHDLAGALVALTDADVEPTVKPIHRKGSATLLAQATERRKVVQKPRARIRFDDKRIIINGERLDGAIFSPDSSDSAIKAMFEQIFSRLGNSVAALHIDVQTMEDSAYRVVTLELDPTGGGTQAGKPVKIYMDDDDLTATWEYGDAIDHLSKLIEMEFPGRDDTMMAGSMILKVKLKD